MSNNVTTKIRYPDFEGKLALVSGAKQGIGKQIAITLAEQGAKVIELDNQFNSDETNERRHNIDVRDYSAIEAVINRIENQSGPIDFAVHAAGILRMGSLLECTEEDWEACFAVNATGTFHFCRAIGRPMSLRKRGNIVVVSSNAASTPRLGMGCYAASKAAVSHFVRCLALELAHHNVRCNIVAPGSTDTPMQRKLWQDENAEEKVIQGSLANYRLGIPLGRIAQTEDIAQTILFLLSNQSKQITMETITVDGGATLGNL